MSDIKNYSESERGDEVFSEVVRAGRRTYFFDVKSTRNDDYYLTITESRKKPNKDGTFSFEKSKLFLYKEDFAKFNKGLNGVIDYIRANKPEFFDTEDDTVTLSTDAGFETGSLTDDLEFESL